LLALPLTDIMGFASPNRLLLFVLVIGYASTGLFADLAPESVPLMNQLRPSVASHPAPAERLCTAPAHAGALAQPAHDAALPRAGTAQLLLPLTAVAAVAAGSALCCLS
jgi:hypothetical protein